MVKAKPDCTGQKSGRLTVLGKGGRSPSGIPMWRCQCDCGEIVERNRFTLDHSKIPSCGCEKRERFRDLALARSKPDCTGQRFGRLTVLGKTEELKSIGGKKTRGLWLCQCDCGNTVKLVREYFERDENPQKSCGCLYKERKGKPNKNAANLTGQKFGDLTAIERIPNKTIHNKPVWLCSCDCGATVERSTHQLRLGYGVGLNCGDRTKHQFWLHYPPTPSPYPKEAGALVAKYLQLTKTRHSNRVDSAVEDKRMDRLIRAAWILCYRRSQGEFISELHERNYISETLRYSKVDVFWRRKLEQNGGMLYDVSGNLKQIGSVMTDLTSQNEAVPETQPENLLRNSSGKRLRFKRC